MSNGGNEILKITSNEIWKFGNLNTFNSKTRNDLWKGIFVQIPRRVFTHHWHSHSQGKISSQITHQYQAIFSKTDYK